MKQVVVAVIALVLGIVLGGLQPRAEIRSLEEKVAQAAAAPCRNQVGQDLAVLFGSGPQVGRRTPPPVRRTKADRPAEPQVRGPEDIAASNPEAAEVAADIDRELDAAEDELRDGLGESLANEEELDLARTALELRRAQARASIIEDADPSDEQLQTIEDAADSMNQDLVGLAEELVDIVNSGEEPSRRDAMEFAADALDTMLAAEERMNEALGADQVANLQDEAIDPFSWLDPGLIDALGGLDAAAIERLEGAGSGDGDGDGDGE